MMKNVTWKVVCFLLALFVIASCSSVSKSVTLDAKKAAILENMLRSLDVPVTSIQSQGETVEVYYETSKATAYDNQVVADWGTIFGAASELKYETIRIHNTVNGVSYATLTAEGELVNAFADGSINQSAFWESVQITSNE